MNYFYLSDVGKKRSMNQDYVKIYKNSEDLTLFLLADGMGGHQAGDVASKLTVETLGELFTKQSFLTRQELVSWLNSEIQTLNSLVFEQGQQVEFRGMGTTLEALCIFNGELVLAHVGDSRSYLLRANQLIQITEDHSLVNELRLMGELTDEEAVHHPQKNIITRSVGMPNELKVDIFTHSISAGDLILMCSDGLSNMLTHSEISEILLMSISLEEKTRLLINHANENGGSDNISVLLVDISEETV